MTQTVHELRDDDIEALLHEEVVGRVAFVDRLGRPNIVPIAYAYDGRSVFGYSLLGAKLDAMAGNPYVCVEIDRVEDMANWRSVVLRGVYEPLSGAAANDAVAMIADRLRTVARAGSASRAAGQTYVERAGGPGIAYRIRITTRHGRRSSSL